MRHGLFARRLFATSIRSVALATATLAGLAMVGSSVIAPASFGDETAGGTQATVPDLFAKSQSSNGLTVSIDQLSPKILTNESELVVSGTITNTGDEALSAPLLMVSMAFSPADSIRELADSLDASTRPGRLISYEETSEDIPGGQTIPFEVHIPVDRLDLYSSYDWGPRALGVDVLSGDHSGADRTIFIWDSGQEVQPTQVNAVVPWTASNSSNTVKERSAITEIAQIPGTTLALDSTVIPRPTRDTSTSKANADGLFASKLLVAEREIIALPTGDADPGVVALAANDQLSALMSASIKSFPTSVEAAGWSATGIAIEGYEAASADLAESNPQSATSQSSDQSGATQTQGSQSETNGSHSQSSNESAAQKASKTHANATILKNVEWPKAETFSTTGLALASDKVTIAPGGALDPDPEVSFTSLAPVEVNYSTGETSTQGATDSTATVLSTNKTLNDLLSWEVSTSSDALDVDQALAGVSAIITRERPSVSRTVEVTASRTLAPSASLVQRLKSLLQQRWVEPTSFSQIASSQVTDVERFVVGPGQLSAETSAALTTLGDALAQLKSFADSTSDPKAVNATLHDDILPTVSASIGTDEQVTRASQFSAKVSNLRSLVSLVPSDTVNLINKSADFPIRVRNDLAWDVNVTVTINPSDPRLKVRQSAITTIPARTVTAVNVPVNAIGSGDIEVTYQINTADGALLAISDDILVRMRAGWEDAFTITVAIAFGLLFVIGLVRSVRKRRAGRKEEENK
ncbi:DUF6049 family protein [Pauljensenia sp. UMB1235]|uniref:DUF6049 family protein n=1 Tax=unclassified Pauljensenia TaxID=2908895 RepID=UPI002550DF10|nr:MULTISPECIES: DUF6049 family protein [unclassified Pauljensenia]MDK6399811.1 DUF6049 family protein [Pauljensenia sp. UMB9872]MDK7172300.1 DUF6049 family protein [Pauljensenia sp. UMB1235]